MTRRDHWEQVYSSKSLQNLGWYTPQLTTSVEWITGLDLAPEAPIIDVGSGASTLVDDLLESGHTDITLLDISAAACDAVAARLGAKFERIRCINADITDADLPPANYELWHDRAVFHFLTDAGDRRRYKAALTKSLKPAGWFIIGTFAPDAPPKCSGLPLQRYGLQNLIEEFMPDFKLIDDKRELHVTPGGVEQMYQYALFRREDE